MSARKPFPRLLILLAILIIPSIGYLLVSSGKNNYSRLDIFGPKEPVSGQPGDTSYHTVAPFRFMNQDGQPFGDENLKGKMYVANFFFATCQTICPKMNMQMKRVQEVIKDAPDIALVSFTVNPDQDSVPVMKAYAEKYQAIPGKWDLLTGDKKQIYELARNSYFLVAQPGDGGPDDFIHSEKLVLVDPDKRIRGFYDGTDYEDVNRLLDEIKVLRWEFSKH